MEKLVIVPTYNERENIDTLLDQLMALPFGLDVLVVDDGSPDGTGGRVKERAASEPRLHLLERAGKMGLGSAYRDGFRYALQHGAEYIFVPWHDGGGDSESLKSWDNCEDETLNTEEAWRAHTLASSPLARQCVVLWPL